MPPVRKPNKSIEFERSDETKSNFQRDSHRKLSFLRSGCKPSIHKYRFSALRGRPAQQPESVRGGLGGSAMKCLSSVWARCASATFF
jgi:hypothetical protein